MYHIITAGQNKPRLYKLFSANARFPWQKGQGGRQWEHFKVFITRPCSNHHDAPSQGERMTEEQVDDFLLKFYAQKEKERNIAHGKETIVTRITQK